MTPGLHSHEDKLLDFAYGELPPSEARAVEAHLAGCPRCSGTLASIRGVRHTMAQLQPEPVPEAGLESLLAYAQQTSRRIQAGPAKAPSLWRRWMAPVGAVAALSVLVVIAQNTVPGMKHLAPSEVAKAAAPAPLHPADPYSESKAAPHPQPTQAVSKEAAKTTKNLASFGDTADDARAVTGEPVSRDGTAASASRAMSVDVDSGASARPSAKKAESRRAVDQLGSASEEGKTGRTPSGSATPPPPPPAPSLQDGVLSANGPSNSMKDTFGGAAPGAAARQEREGFSEFQQKLGKVAEAPKAAAPQLQDKAEVAEKGRASADRKADAAPADAENAQAAGEDESASTGAASTLGGISLRGSAGGGSATSGSGVSAPASRGSGGRVAAASPAPESPALPPSMETQAAARVQAPRKQAAPTPLAKKDAQPLNREALIAQAKQAHGRGDFSTEQRLWTALLPLAQNPAERREWLSHLCDAEYQQGQAAQGCELLAREFPETSEGRVASRRAKSVDADGASGKSGAVPSKAKPARKASSAGTLSE